MPTKHLEEIRAGGQGVPEVCGEGATLGEESGSLIAKELLCPPGRAELTLQVGLSALRSYS